MIEIRHKTKVMLQHALLDEKALPYIEFYHFYEVKKIQLILHYKLIYLILYCLILIIFVCCEDFFYKYF